MKRNFRGFGIYVIIFLIIILGWYSFGSKNIGGNTCTRSEFEQNLEDDKINSIVIKQNEEVPTGTATILLKDGSRVQMNVSDVSVLQDTLKEADFDNYTLKDVPGQNALIEILPTLLMVIVLIIFIMSMNAQAGGGGNSKMMNFGKNRATLTMGENVKVRFKDVAGLNEEKEEL